MNQNARHITAEVLLNEEEKRNAVAVCKALGIGLSTWYRGLGNAAVSTHGKRPRPPAESRLCRGVGKAASRASGALFERRRV